MKKIITLIVCAGQITYCMSQTCNPLDQGFGSTGKTIGHHSTNYSISGRNIIVQSDNKIIQICSDGNQFGAIRYNSDGSLDNSFGTNGKAAALAEQYIQYGVLQGDGKIVLAGYAYNQSSLNDIVLARYNSNGTPDNSFGTGGKIVTAVTTGDDYASGISIQPDGKIVVAGSSKGNNCPSCNTWWGNEPYCMPSFTILRYNSDGTLDNTFGQNGKSFIAMTSPNGGRAISVLIQSDGKIVAVGDSLQFYCDDYYGGGYYSSGLMMARFNSNGAPDNSFGENGMIKGNPGFGNASAIALQSDGKIVVLGEAQQGGSLVARYNTDGSLDNSFGQSGKVDITSGNLNALAILPDGKIALSGGSNSGFFVCRLESNGSLDNSFNNTGKLYFHPGADNTYDYANGIALQGDKLVIGGNSQYSQGNNYYIDILVVRLTTSVSGLPIAITPQSPVYPCQNENVILSVTNVGTYQWYKNGSAITGATGGSYTATTNGEYFVKVTSGNECGQSDPVRVIYNGLPVTITPSSSLNICAGQTVDLQSSESGTIQWFKDGAIIGGATNAIYTASITGYYSVYVKNSKGCGQSSSVYVQVNAGKPFVNWNSPTLNTNNGYNNYQWYLNGNAITGANSYSFQPTQTGLYKVNISDYSCTTMSDEFTLNCNSVIVLKPSVSWNFTQLTSTPSGYTGYQWYLNGNAITGANASSFTPVQTGIYKVTVTGNLNCTNTSNEFNLDCNLASPSKPVIDWNGTQFSTGSGYTSYQWYKDDVAIAGATSNTYIPSTTQFGMYKVTVTGNFNCSWTSDAKPYQFTATSDIVIGDVTLRYYPNPASNTIYIDIPSLLNKKMTVILTDITGRKLIQQSLTRGQNQVPVEKLPSGLYQLQIQYGYEKIAQKIVLLK